MFYAKHNKLSAQPLMVIDCSLVKPTEFGLSLLILKRDPADLKKGPGRSTLDIRRHSVILFVFCRHLRQRTHLEGSAGGGKAPVSRHRKEDFL